MMNRRRKNEAAQRFAERKQREDEAPRLQEAVPALATLRIVLEHRKKQNGEVLSSHTRLVVVPRAPALFIVPCADRDCADGEYDITRAMMTQLANGETTFDGDDECHGLRHGSTCHHQLHFQASASYSP
jgi:hypothetical protein